MNRSINLATACPCSHCDKTTNHYHRRMPMCQMYDAQGVLVSWCQFDWNAAHPETAGQRRPYRQRTHANFIKGDRVKYSAIYLARHKVRDPDRLGTVVGFGVNDAGSVRVVPDGRKPSSVDTLDAEYIELAPIL